MNLGFFQIKNQFKVNYFKFILNIFFLRIPLIFKFDFIKIKFLFIFSLFNKINHKLKILIHFNFKYYKIIPKIFLINSKTIFIFGQDV